MHQPHVDTIDAAAREEVIETLKADLLRYLYLRSPLQDQATREATLDSLARKLEATDGGIQRLGTPFSRGRLDEHAVLGRVLGCYTRRK